jgi:hypothetical protein
MVAVPAATPVTSPVELTVAMLGFNDDQLPPVELDNCMDNPTPTAVGPVIGSGTGFTVISEPVRKQPFGKV